MRDYLEALKFFILLKVYDSSQTCAEFFKRYILRYKMPFSICLRKYGTRLETIKILSRSQKSPNFLVER